MRTANPAMQTFVKPQSWADLGAQRSTTMSYAGTIRASFVLTGLCAASAVLVYLWLTGVIGSGAPPMGGLLIGGVLGGLVLGLVISFNPRSAPYLGPVYALLEGVFVGAVSVYVPSHFNVGPGVVIQAMLLTFGILFALLTAFSLGMIRLGGTATKVVLVATAGIAIYYLAAWLLSLFGVPILRLGWEGGLIGIGFSAFVVVIASLNLVLDFQFIEAGVVNKAPKHMEWYGAFGLLVTLVWLYIEVLRLLAKINSRD